MHHTGGRGDPQNVIADWAAHRPSIGTQYILDRNGVVHDVEKRVWLSRSRSHHQRLRAGTGLSNFNSVGMEVIARDDADVTAVQREAAQRFVRERYPNTPVFGHGEVNPVIARRRKV